MRFLLQPERYVPVAFLIVGCLIATAYPALNASPGETGQAAATLLIKGYIGDPYVIPTGPTAHVSPLLAWLLAGMDWVFGVDTVRMRVAQGVMAAGLYALCVRCTLLLCARLRPGRGVVWIATGLLVATPVFLFQSVVYFRQWDQPFAALFLIQGWLSFETAQRSGRRYRGLVVLALLTGIGALFSPTMLPVLSLSVVALIWLHRRSCDWRVSTLLCAALVAACLVPWGMRNQVALGHFIVTRSNFGLELNAGNGPGATGMSGSGIEAAMHPHDWQPAAEQLRDMGEVAFMRAQGDRAKAWINANPLRFATLTLQRAAMGFFPPVALVGWVPGIGAQGAWLLLTILGGMKVVALAGAVWLRRRPILMLQYSVLPLGSYFVTHMNVRYEFIVYFTTVAGIAMVADALLGIWRSGSKLAPRPTLSYNGHQDA